MAGNAKRNSDRQKQHYKNYENQNKWEVNKRKKIERHVKKFPNDQCAVSALERGFVYHKPAPKAQHWSRSDKATATLFTEFGRSGYEVIQMKKDKAAREKARKEAQPNE